MKDISKRIKELRMERNMTQDDLAERLHVTRQTVSSWETKKTRPDVETLEAISQAFGIELTELLYGKQKEDRFERFRTTGPSDPKMVKQAKIFGIIFVIGFLSRFLAVPLSVALAGLFGGSYRMGQVLIVIGTVIIGNWSFALLGPFVLSLISIKNDVSIKNVRWRKRSFVIGVVLAVMALLSWPIWILSVQLDWLDFVPIPVTQLYAMANFILFQNRYILLAIASLIWLGKKEPRENVREAMPEG
ncbi:MAG: helix-turn-helix domain-containing protein [Firmicutes bacterium]|nr:helix-turn-helix domain-containing protein [Bacillota bacterium]